MPIPKPDVCQGCPAYGWGPHWVPDTVVPDSEVVFVFQNPGEYEELGKKVIQRIGKNQYVTESVPPQPLIGPTGYDVTQRWLPLAGQGRDRTSLLNAIRCRYLQTNELPPAQGKLSGEVRQFCHKAHSHTPPTTKLIVACGSHAAALHGCPGSVTDWRGYVIPGSNPPVLVTLHPADLLHQPKMGIACVSDWKKVPRILEGSWPKPLPPIQYYHNSEEDRQWLCEARTKAPYISIDTEYVPGPPGGTSVLKLIGLSHPYAMKTLCVWWNEENQATFTSPLHELISNVPVVMWNAVADIPVLEDATGIRYEDYYRVEDPMLQHALLWSELPHTLAFCASVDGAYPKLKHLMSEDLALYNQGDVLETSHLHEVYNAQMSQDPSTHAVYQSQALPLLTVLLRSTRRGIRVHRNAVVDAITQYRSILERATTRAREACGLDINLGSSPQVQAYLYTVKGYQVQKHFKTKRPTVNTDAINLLRSTFLPVDGAYEEQEGLNYEDVCGRIQQGADPFLESCALHSSVRSVLSTYLIGLVRAVYSELDESKRKKARTRAARSPITVEEIVERVYPDYKQHAQANGRWSLTNPPMAGVPKALHHCFIPDAGHAWIVYDFKQIEPRIRACVSHDTPRLRDFALGKDIYESTCVEMFGRYDPILRKLGKTVELALSYGKKPTNVHHVPGIMGYGFGRKELILAAENYLRAHPEQTRWMASHVQSIHTHGYSREPVASRKRNLLGHWGDQEREGLNQPMQSGAASLTNLTILAITRACPSVVLVNNRFDEHWWSVPLEDLDRVRATMIEILARPWTINGITMVFPVDPPELKVIYAPKEVA